MIATDPVQLPLGLNGAPESVVILAAPIPSGGWLAVLFYGNWALRDALNTSGTSFRAEIRDRRGVLVAGDWLPLGEQAKLSQIPIPEKATALEVPISRYGQQWTLRIVDADGSTHARIGAQPLLIEGAASLFGLLIALLVFALGRARVTALGMVDSATAELRDSERRFRAVVQHASDTVLIIDRQYIIRYQSDSSERLFGYRPGELLGRNAIELVHPDDVATVLSAGRAETGSEARVSIARGRLVTADGEWRYTESVVADLLDDPAVAGIVLTIRDVTDRYELEQKLRHQAFHDPLTGLANRALFADRVTQALASRRTVDTGLAVMFCDLDDFKTVNDSLGHAAGDQLLSKVAEQLVECVRAGDSVARLSGDEFAVLLTGPATEAEVVELPERILASMRRPVWLDDRAVVATSVGIAIEPAEGIDTETLLGNADVAMYLAKAEGKGRHALLQPAIAEKLTQRLAAKADLTGMLERDELVVHYQPVLDLPTGSVVAVEALVRWQHPRRGLLLPSEFIPLAEETGLIVEIGRSVLRTACAQVASWRMAGIGNQANGGTYGGGLALNVNLSARQLEAPDLVPDVRAALEDSGLPAESLTLEITESMLLHDGSDVACRLAELKPLGVTLAIDDFGTGYSSLGYLRRLPVDVVKIDRSFVQALTGGDAEPMLARAVEELARALGLRTVAEGIENESQLAELVAMGCPQG